MDKLKFDGNCKGTCNASYFIFNLGVNKFQSVMDNILGKGRFASEKQFH